MKIILLQHIPGLGKKGDLKEVSDGYFRNQLAPKKLAMIADEGAVRSVKNQLKKSQEKQEKSLESARFIEERLKDQTIILQEKASDTGNLYAAIHQKEIAQAIHKQYSLDLDLKSILLNQAIKHVGEYVFEVQTHPRVKFSVKLQINAL